MSRRLNDKQSDRLDAPVTAEELAATIKHLKKHSAPGLDGLGAALYLLDPESFGEILSVVFASEFSHGKLLSSQRKSCVSLLYKKGDRRDPGNYRPISLMQVDVKILSKTFAYRLQHVLPELIHCDQKGFVKGRSLHHHVRLLHDIKQLLHRRDEQGYALFLDFAKAYDRVNWSYLVRVLERAGCGPRFCSWVKLLYSDVQAILSLNGSLQEVLYPSRGVKQGDPLSSLLFVLSIEPLANLLRENPRLGIPIADDTTATGLYFADDTTLLSRSLQGLARQVDIVQTYCDGSGARLNLNKSQLVAFHGEKISAQATRLGVATSGSVTYLGIPFGPTTDEPAVMASLETRIGTRIARWASRARTYRGRLLIVQAMVLSVLWHFTPHFTIPDAMIKRIQSLVDKYLLTRNIEPSRHFVKLAKASVCRATFKSGGIQLPQIMNSLRCQRIRLLQQLVEMEEDALWRVVTAVLLAKIVPGGGQEFFLDFLGCPYNVRSAIVDVSSLSQWWLFTWKTWSSLSWLRKNEFLDPVTFQQSLLNSYVWHSSHLLLTVGVCQRTLLGRAGATRHFRSRFAAATDCRRLLDFMQSGWPEAPQFLARFLTAVPEWTLRRRIHHLMELYNDLSDIYRKITRPQGLLTGPSKSTLALPLVGKRNHDRITLFPHMSKQDVKHLFTVDEVPVRDHPIGCQLMETYTAAFIQDSIESLKKLHGVVLPVYADLQFRLSWMLLPTKSRFPFLLSLDSGDLSCGYQGCNAVETTRHLFFDCPRAATLWGLITQDWADVTVGPLTWSNVCALTDPLWASRCATRVEPLSVLWMIIRSAVIHAVWTARNKHNFEDQPPLEATTAIFRIYSVFGAHFRARLRASDPSARGQLKRCLDDFAASSGLGRFVADHPRLFTLRPQSLYTNNSGRLCAPPSGTD
ncbi:Pol Polyprotein [Phytophthora megakarya]|uniref:Pol Polyprotein n=1 Tax=Phytophthora megakarya TaxID=4795 RepID=A0A225VK73_9STRA|nr:Pol Polyprotein [Phytophthora megakarya]